MGKGGRTPTPTAVLKLHGSSTLRRKENKGKVELQPPIGSPAEPSLPEHAKAIWQAIIADLLSVKDLLTRVDGPQLERYARYVVRWRLVEDESDKMIATAGSAWMVLANDDLRPALRGLWAESRRLDQAMKEIEGNFAMTPADRRRLGAAVEGKPKMPQRMKPA